MISGWVAVLSLATALAAAPLPGSEMKSPVVAGSKITYIDLLRSICPDARVDADDPSTAMATRQIAIRQVGFLVDTAPRDGVSIKIESAHTVATVKAAAARVLVSFAMPIFQERPERVLAVFDLSSAPRLVDIASLPAMLDDEGVYSRTLSLDGDIDVYLFEAHTYDFSQAVDGYYLVYLNGDHLLEILRVFLLSRETFIETPDISTVQGPERHRDRFVVRAVWQGLPGPRARTYSAEYRWDARTRVFVTTSHELEELDAFNQGHSSN